MAGKTESKQTKHRQSALIVRQPWGWETKVFITTMVPDLPSSRRHVASSVIFFWMKYLKEAAGWDSHQQEEEEIEDRAMYDDHPKPSPPQVLVHACHELGSRRD